MNLLNNLYLSKCTIKNVAVKISNTNIKNQPKLIAKGWFFKLFKYNYLTNSDPHPRSPANKAKIPAKIGPAAK